MFIVTQYFCWKSCENIQTELWEEYPDLPVLCEAIILWLVTIFMKQVMFVIKKIRQRLLLTTEKLGDVNVYCSQPEDHQKDLIWIGMPYSSIQMPLKNLGLNHYCIHVMQELKTWSRWTALLLLVSCRYWFETKEFMCGVLFHVSKWLDLSLLDLSL